MGRNHFFVNKDGQLCTANVIASTALLAALVAAITSSLVRWIAPAGDIASVVVNAVLAAFLLGPSIYFLIITPIKRGYTDRLAAGSASPDKDQFVTIDPLTRTLNRRGITSTLLEAMAQAQRYSNPLSIAMIDIDTLARINDKFGRDAGNKALELIAYTITDVLRLPDRVGRQGDDEFVVVMPQTKAAAAAKVAERIRAAIEGIEIESAGHVFRVSVSIGVTEFHKGQDLERFLSDAQAALQQAKRAEGNRVMRHKAERRK